MKNLRKAPTEMCGSAEIQPNGSLPKKTGSVIASSIKYNNLEDRVRTVCINALFLILTCHGVFGEIKNGYGNIHATKESLRILRAMLIEDPNMVAAKRRKIGGTAANLEEYISYFNLTEDLLSQFKEIAPKLYAQVDTITDRLGRQVDVHIKFVRAASTEIQAMGSTYVNQIYNDMDACQSEHGAFTVSVKVWIVPKALEVLAHELGHIKFMVPNFARYLEFYKSHYNVLSEFNSAGHHSADPSGLSATQFAKSFQKSYSSFLKMSVRRPHDPPTLLARLRRERRTL